MFGGRISAMKMKRIILSAVSAAVAAAACTIASGAYISVPSSSNSGLVATNQSWKLVINGSYNVDYTKAGALQFVAKVSDIKAYEKDKTAGVYGDTEKAFADFSGCIALGANDWFQYDYSGIDGAAGDNVSAASVTLGDNGTVVFSADLHGKNITNEAQAWTAVSFSEWGNASADYSVAVVSATLYDLSGNVLISFDGNGNCLANAAAETQAETTVPETTPETTTTTTVPETTTTTTTTTTAATTTTTTTTTTAATTTTTEATTTTTEAVTTTEEITTEETTEEAAEETTEEAEEAVATEEVTTTTAAETTTTTTEAETTAATEISEETAPTTAAPAAAAQSAGITSKSDSLMIVLIAAGVVIVGALVGFVIVAARRKK